VETTGLRATFTGMEESTAEDWAIIGKSFVAHGRGLADRILDHLRLLDGDFGGFAVDRLTHSLQTATRAQLLSEYQARLDQTTGDAWKLWTEMQELNAAIQEIQTRVPELQTASENAERAYMAGDLPALTYVTLQSAVLNRQSEISDLRQSLWNDAIALSSVLGTQIQPAVEMKEPVP